ncbi:tetratricopeptide repeat protein [Spirosoma aerolatum]|uniref:tetratricopeptide repeat protein n=1 Tax=Spirosoma aerolatum TaxID=1211326 RepID=UPI0009AE6D12|nr:tetratricopeptide repeat protein [Spirosoma aerolatum]
MKFTQQIAFILIIGFVSLSQTYAQTLNAFKESYSYESKKEYKKAIAALSKANDDSYEVNLRQGWLHYLAGLLTESVNYYQKAITQRPTSIEARLGYALPASALNNWDNVTEQYQAVLRLDPNNTVTNYRVGLMYYYRKEYKTAESYFQKVLKLYPFDHDSLLMLGWTKYMLGQGNEARVLFNRALLNTPTDSSATQGLAALK